MVVYVLASIACVLIFLYEVFFIKEDGNSDEGV